MYEPPLEIMEFNPLNTVMEKMRIDERTHQEEWIFQQIKSYGVNVDKEELIKALNYDRQQYQKGYADGIKEFAEIFLKIVHDNHYLLVDRINSKDYGMFTIGIEQAVDETKKEMVGDTK